ncbi:MAG: chromate resistance protein [Nitrospirae bacterium]|nr:chromate resistance protein [Nitrospirota bacterium]
MSYKKGNYADTDKWLLFFYSIPAQPVNNRIKIWRRLIKAGALQFKGAVYILPYSEEHYEFCQWLVSEAGGLGGEAAFTGIKHVETMKDSEIVELFNRQREEDYKSIEKDIEELERRLGSLKKGSLPKGKNLTGRLERLSKEFEEIKKTDFFSSKTGIELDRKIKTLRNEINAISASDIKRQKEKIIAKKIKDYQEKRWVTRKRPFVDRMASAWLIKRFIDTDAIFDFIDESALENISKGKVTFDIKGGEFTHTGSLCTYEALLKSFGIKDKAVRAIGEIVHEIDIKDERYKNPEAKGIEDILIGITKTARDDMECLEKGMSIFEMLYTAKTK